MGYNGVGENHGMVDALIYYVYKSMKSRCYYEKHKKYSRYGGRGIKVCDEWKDSFISFYNFAINNGYKEGLQLDRIDNNGDYEPSNCQFITSIENKAVGKRNKYSNNKSGYNGVTYINNRNKWNANITVFKKQKNLGLFNTKEEALQARIDAEIFYFGEQKTNL